MWKHMAGVIALMMSGVTGQTADLDLAPKTKLVFASADEGREVLGARDAFISHLSPFDRAARLHTDRAVSEDEFLEHVRACVQEWSPKDQANVTAAWAQIEPALAALALPFPARIALISTNGQEEGAAAYTRGQAIILPPKDRAGETATLARLLAHELFHILSRHNPALRDQLYAAIGFVPCPDLSFPESLRARQISNPDAPELRHRIQVTVGGKAEWAIPVIYAATEKYDKAHGGEFFDYLQFQLLLVDAVTDGAHTPAKFDGTMPRLIDISAAPEFLTQVGQNTGYIIHPEEILAENFTLLVSGTQRVPSPDVLARIRRVLAAARVSE